MGCLQLRGFFDRYWCTCNSSRSITNFVRAHLKDGWLDYILDAESFRAFSDSRGHRTLEGTGCGRPVSESIEKPFDESIIVWHLATDFCFHRKGASPDQECVEACREISNYMMHLLFAEPEMLMPGSRRNLFAAAYQGIEDLLSGKDLSHRNKRKKELSVSSRGTRLASLVADEKELTQKIFYEMDYLIKRVESGGRMSDSFVLGGESFIHDALALSQELVRLGDEKMWEIIKGVWVEMPCFSAGRCRGYLHAKSLGSGGEYLSFVSLLMSHAGIETFAERQQRVQLRLSKEERVNIARRNTMLNVDFDQEAESDPATISSAAQDATPSASQVKGPIKEEKHAAMEIVVSP